jgi:hypothetical protein
MKRWQLILLVLVFLALVGTETGRYVLASLMEGAAFAVSQN